MSSSDQDRFLIALAKFLGENPTIPSPLDRVIVCPRWLLDEIVNEVIPHDGEFHLDLEIFNRLMLHCGRRFATSHFYEYFFRTVTKLEAFEEAVERYRIKAMWLFGNFSFGYKKIAGTEAGPFTALMRKTEPISHELYTTRVPFDDIEPIPAGDLSLLGYISADEVKDLDIAKKLIETLLDQPGKTAETLVNIGSERQAKTSTLLARYGISFPRSGPESLSSTRLTEIYSEISNVYGPLRTRQEAAIEIGRRNTHRYLALPHLDVYVATSMREHGDYIAQHDFVRRVFDDPQVAPLRLRYFDPTLSYVDDRISKGLVEMLMLQRARVTIYNAGAEDTLGKDSELAATLAQGKAVIVYVPSDPKIVTLSDGRKVDLDRRARTFRVGHPLGLQINVRTGVAHGILVVRTPEQCAEMLRKVILHDLQFTILHQGGNYLLEEQETKSVLRVVSDDPFLTHAFWTYFRYHVPEED